MRSEFHLTDAQLDAPDARLGLGLRTAVRALDGMQKEALVASSAADPVWRLLSDEGPYLAGTDLAPPPLGFFVTGNVCAHMNELLALAAARGVELRTVRLTQDNFYSMKGSALAGTMTGGALAPTLRVEAECDLSEPELQALAAEAVATSPLAGLVAGVHDSLFALVHNGSRLATGRVAPLPGDVLPDPRALFETAGAVPGTEVLMEKTREADQVEGEGGASSSLQAEQNRILNPRGVCTIRPDGVKVVDQMLFKPIGSQFRMLSDEEGRAPDAFSYLAAGIAFCFMTQLGRYAKIKKQQLDDYRVVQDTHFSTDGRPAAPVETHVYLDTPEDDAAVRQMLDMGEQTCFLHALCRTDLVPEVEAHVLQAA